MHHLSQDVTITALSVSNEAMQQRSVRVTLLKYGHAIKVLQTTVRRVSENRGICFS